MIRIHSKHIEALEAAQTIDPVHDALASALQLELATIPVYLTGLFSLKPGVKRETVALVQSVVVEEMLHLTFVCNTLIAIGGTPQIAAAGKSLQYPGPLPLSVDDGLQVSLGALTRQQVQQVFMAIEKPATSAILPGEREPNPPPAIPGEYASIGDFYLALIAALHRFPGHFDPGSVERQVDAGKWFALPEGTGPDGKVRDAASAERVLRAIMWQGEGRSDASPYACDTAALQTARERGTPVEFAHYYKFGEIYHGKCLVPDASAPSEWSYSGAAVALDDSMVYRFLPNATLSDYDPQCGAAIAGQQFYQAYERLLQGLDRAFQGTPSALEAALGVMYELKLVAQKVVQFPASQDDPQVIAAPPFMLTRAQ